MQIRPTTSNEDLMFLRERVVSMARLASILAIFMLGVVALIDLMEEGRVAWEKPAKWWQALGSGVLLLVWVVNSRWQLSRRGIRLSEGAGLVFSTWAFAIMTCQMSPAQSPHMAALMAATLIAVLRAVFVPSSPQRTLLLGLVQGIPLIVIIVYFYRSASPGDMEDLRLSFEVEDAQDVAGILGPVAAGWWIASMATATAASHVIYGLRRRVREIRHLGQYALQEKLGEGGMGQVFRASHAMLRRPTAVKLLASSNISPGDIQRFEKEVQLTASLSHPHTVTVYDYGRTPDGVFYYAMELIEGATLGEIVQVSGPQDPRRVKHILAAALGALAEAHGIGLVHRDIKPANIMLSQIGGAYDFTKVLDFGLVMEVVHKELSTLASEVGDVTVAGTPLYMAPESFEAKATIDGRTDIYALGAVAYFLLTGTHVFDGKTVAEVASRHLNESPEPPSSRLGSQTNFQLEEFVLLCLAKDPKRRPDSAHEALDLVRSIEMGEWTTRDAQEWWQTFGFAVADGREKFGTKDMESQSTVGFLDSQATITLGMDRKSSFLEGDGGSS